MSEILNRFSVFEKVDQKLKQKIKLFHERDGDLECSCRIQNENSEKNPKL